MSAVALSVVNSITETANQTAVGGTANDPIIAIATNPVLPGTGSVTVPKGTTAQRVLTQGALRLNTTSGFFEVSTDGATWVNLAAGGGGITTINGTALQIDVITVGPTATVSIDAGYVGQASINTLGTITTGIWNGTNVPLNHGGTSASLVADNGALVYSTAGAFSLLASTATANQIPLSGAHAAPTWSTATYPATTTASNLLYSNGANTITGLATANNGLLVTSNTGAPSILAGPGTTGQVLQANAAAAPSFSTASYPSTTTLNQILYSSAANVIGGIAATANGTLITGVAGIPSIIALANGTILIGTAGAPAASTATYPSTTTINQLLYSSAANTIGGLATANGGMLITSHTGVPSIAAMTDGQVMIGSTAGLPQPAQIGNGTGITVTSASNAITITNSGVTSNVATANQTTVSGATGAVTIGIASNPILPGTGGVTLPSGTTGQEAGGAGTIRYNTTTSLTELTNDGATWHAVSIAGGTVTSVTASSPLASSGGTTPNITLNSVVPLNLGGTNGNLTASVGGVVWSDASQMQILSGTATASKMLLSGSSATPSWSTSTIPTSAGATAGKVLISDGTNYVLSTPTFPNASATSGKFIRSDGTNWIASTPTLPTTAGSAGTILRSDGTNFLSSTSTFSDTYTSSNLLYSNGANTVTGLATGNNGLLVTSNTGVPSILAGPGTTGQVLQANTAAAPSFSTASYPSTTTINQILYSSAANTVSGLATQNNGVITTGTSGTPVVTALGTDGQLIIGSSAGAPAAATITAGTNITVTNGHNTITIASTGGSSELIFIQANTSASSATSDFAALFSSSYDQYLFTFTNVLPATNATVFQMLLGTGGGPVYTNSGYAWTNFVGVGVGSYQAFSSTSDSSISLNPTSTYLVSNSSTNAGYSGYLWLINTNTGSHVAQGSGNFNFLSSAGAMITGMSGFNVPAATWTAARFQFSSGNIASGIIRMYGLKNS